MVGLLLFSFVILFSLGLFYFSQERKQILQQKFEELHAISNSKINQLVEFHKSHFRFLNYISGTEPFLQYIREIVQKDLSNANLLKENINSFTSPNYYTNVFLTDSTGFILLDASSSRNVHSIVQDRDTLIDSYTLKAIKEVFNTGKHYVNEFLDNMPVGTAPYMLVSPVLSKDSNVIATIVSLVDATEYIIPILNQWSEFNRSNTSILARKEAGSVRILDPSNKFAKINFISVESCPILGENLNFKIEDKVFAANLGFFTGLDLDSNQVIGKYTKIFSSDWYLVERVYSSHIYGAINKKASYAAIIGAIAFLFSLTALLGLHYHKVRRNKNRLIESQKEEEECRRELAEIRLELWRFSANNNLDKTLKEILDRVCTITNSSFAFIYFLEPDQETISLTAWSTETAKQFASFISRFTSKSIRFAGVWTQAIKTGEPLVHNNFAEEQNKRPLPKGHPVLTREIVVPVTRKGKVVAVMGVANKPILYDSNDVFLASFIADVLLEVSRSKFKEEELKKSEEKYRGFFYDHSAINMIIDSSNGNILDANNSAADFYGWSVDELKKMNMSEINTLSHNDVAELAKKALDFTNYSFELQQKKADGSLVEVDVFAGRVFIENKPCIYANIHDVTLKKYREKAQDILYAITRSSMGAITLEQLVTTLKQGLGSLVDVSNLYIALYVSDKNSLRVEDYSNQGSSGVYWLSMDSIVGHVFKSHKSLILTSKEIAPFVLKHNLATPLNTPECLLCLPLVFVNKARGVLVLKSYKDSNAYDSDSLILMDMVAHELSSAIARLELIEDLVYAKAKAEESNRLKSAFIANLSHEVRTPINAIVGFLDLLSDPSFNKEHREVFLEQVKAGSDWLTKTLNNLVEVSEIESGTVSISRSSIDVNFLLKSLYEQFSKASVSKEISLKLNLKVPGSLALVNTDEDKVLTILSELLGNSFKFTKEGVIELGNYIEGDKLFFYVNDTGCGIDSAKIESLFNYFEVINVKLTRKHSGVGLGLPIAKSYVEVLGGALNISSEIGKYTSVHFWIPL